MRNARQTKRLKHPADYVLKEFVCQNNRAKHPKKEYVRCWAIRHHKRTLRRSRTSRRARTAKNRPDERSQLERAWDQFKASSPWGELKHIADAKTNPSCGRTGLVSGNFRSFNNAFCAAYFQTPRVLESYTAFVDYIFLHDPAELCLLTKLLCCESDQHSITCRERWDAMKHYLKCWILEELDVSPLLL